VMVRGLATGEVEGRQVWLVVWREARIGLVVGLVCGAALGITATVWHGSAWVGLIVGLALTVNLMLAKVAGSLVPVILQRIGLDPAVASGPFIATITDTFSMLVYFTFAALVLRAVL